MKIPLNNPKGAVILIVMLIALFVAYKAKATELELGATYTSQFNGGSALILSERFAGKVDVGIAVISNQEWEAVKVKNNGLVWAGYVAEKPESWFRALPTEVSIGAGYWFQEDRSPITSCHSTFMLGLKWRFGPHASVGIRHWSNAGVCDKNRGQDVLTFGWRF